MPTPKKRVKKGRTIKGWAVMLKGGIQPCILFNTKKRAEQEGKLWGLEVKPALIKIEE
jgi:hypothetical protein